MHKHHFLLTIIASFAFILPVIAMDNPDNSLQEGDEFEKRDIFKCALWRKVNNLTNQDRQETLEIIRDELTSMKEEIQTQNPNVTEADLKFININLKSVQDGLTMLEKTPVTRLTSKTIDTFITNHSNCESVFSQMGELLIKKTKPKKRKKSSRSSIKKQRRNTKRK